MVRIYYMHLHSVQPLKGSKKSKILKALDLSESYIVKSRSAIYGHNVTVHPKMSDRSSRDDTWHAICIKINKIQE